MRKFEILHGECACPHEVLGMHQVTIDEKIKLQTTVFMPDAKEVSIFQVDNPAKTYGLCSVEDGFFEGIIPRRKIPFTYGVTCTDERGNTWSYIDPYQFGATFTDFDMYLFGEGTDYEIHHKLGAHFEEREGIKGVRFAVWAPNAKRVSIVGEFNLWDGRRHQMRHLKANGIWEIFIPGIENGTFYKYEIKTAENVVLYKADPYAAYSELRPNTASRVWAKDSYTWQDKDWLSKRDERAYYKEAVSIYELHIGSWKKHFDGTFYTYRELADDLVSYVKDMGYTHVELMGVLEHPFDGSWGYQVTGYFAPTSRYGNPDDFKYFVDVMHRNDIGVLLDWVPAHFPKDAFALEKFDGTALYEHALPIQANHPQWGTLIFNYGRNEVKLFLIANALSWLETYHIDGLRVDAVASMLYLDYGRENDDYVRNAFGGRENLEAVAFIQKLNEVVYGKYNGVMMIAEESTSWPGVTHPVHDGNGLGFGFKWNMGWMNDMLSYMKCDPFFRKYEHQKITFSIMYAFSENFILPLSHDEVVHGKSSMLYKMPGDEWQKFANVRALYGYMFMHPGKKMLFMGNDIGQTTEWSEKRELDWYLLQYEPHQKLHEYVRDLNHFYKDHGCLWEMDDVYEGFEWIECDNVNESIIAFMRKSKKNNEKLVAIVNFTPQVRECYKIGVDQLGTYEEVFTSDKEAYFGSGVVNGQVEAKVGNMHYKEQYIEVTVPPLGITVFSLKN